LIPFKEWLMSELKSRADAMVSLIDKNCLTIDACKRDLDHCQNIDKEYRHHLDAVVKYIESLGGKYPKHDSKETL
jgi:hypothetical protein